MTRRNGDALEGQAEMGSRKRARETPEEESPGDGGWVGGEIPASKPQQV